MCANAARRTANPAPIATIALVAAVPTLCPTIIAQACSNAGENPLPAETASANGIEVPRNALHPGLKVIDGDEEKSEPRQDGSGRARSALGDQPEKGADAEHR